MFGLGAPELLIVLVVVVLLFGSTRLPKLARSLGEAHKEIRGVTAGIDAEPEHPAVASAPATTASSETVTVSLDDLRAMLAERDAAGREGQPHNAA